MKGRAKLSFICKAFLTAYSLSVTFHAPLVRTAYESVIDYITASIYELLGEYHFSFLLLFIMALVFYMYAEEKGITEKKASAGPSAFFACCLLLGRSYYETGTWQYCFGSPVNFIKTALAFMGYTFLFQTCMAFLREAMEKRQFTEEKNHFLTKHCFLKAFLIILAAWSPFLLLSYPGNLCWDVIGQIEQVILQTGYSMHHPLAHTLLAGGMVQLGKVLCSSYEVGLFAYILLQTVMLAAALAATVVVLKRRHAGLSVLVTLLVLYCVTPVYSNVVTTALKDVPFSAFVIGYVICYALLLETPALLKNRRFVVGFVLLQLGVILFRNNGLPMILLSGVFAFFFLYKRLSVRERIAGFFIEFGAGVMLGRVILLILVQLTAAAPGSRGEILSIPFQQTARYLQCYRHELGEEEREAIEAVLGDVETIAEKYDPAISDPVKALFNKEATAAELVRYLKAWCTGLGKHPAVYAEAFLVHIYGWFTPSVTSAIRYEASYDVIRQGGLFPNAEKLLLFYYRYADRFTPLGALQNIGLAVWGLIYLTWYQMKNKKKTLAAAGCPLWVSLLICMASPCFFLHPRYAFPILFTLPFLYGMTLTEKR